jgi:hypothetical protein
MVLILSDCLEQFWRTPATEGIGENQGRSSEAEEVLLSGSRVQQPLTNL